MKVGHGGTLDPLASGVLVLGVGKGTSMLQSYLEGDKHYTAACELGYETDTLDAEGKLIKSAPWDHVTTLGLGGLEETIVPKFTGRIEQVPPLYSAIRIDGKRVYEIARADPEKTAEDMNVEIPKREVEVYGLEVKGVLEEAAIRSGVVDGVKFRDQVQLLEEAAAAKAAEEAAAAEANGGGVSGEVDEKSKETNDNESRGKKKTGRRRNNNNREKKNNNFKKCPFNEVTVPSIQSDSTTLELPQFSIKVRCGGGTYIRSLVRDIGYELDTVATMTGLVRTKQGPFVLEDMVMKEDWTADNIYEAIRKSKERQIG